MKPKGTVHTLPNANPEEKRKRGENLLIPLFKRRREKKRESFFTHQVQKKKSG